MTPEQKANLDANAETILRGADSPSSRADCSAWIPVSEKLPRMDIPVWMFLPDIRQPIIGCRSDGGEGWLWCRCYNDYWFDGEWKTSTAEADEPYQPTHWMPLPDLPNAAGQPPAAQENP